MHTETRLGMMVLRAYMRGAAISTSISKGWPTHEMWLHTVPRFVFLIGRIGTENSLLNLSILWKFLMK